LRILHLVPASSGELGGVQAYARALAEALGNRFGVGNTLLPLGRPLAYDEVPGERAASGERLLEQVDAFAGTGSADDLRLFLHYSNYGFEARGCPLWLPGFLASVARSWPGSRLLTFFHEVYATGPPWRSSFWLFPVQRWIAQRVASASHRVATNLELYARILRPWTGRERIPVMPVFSTVGEPDRVPPLSERPARLAVFGSAGLRRRAWSELKGALETSCRALGIDEVLDIGPPTELPGGRLGSSRIERCGILPASQVSDLLLSSRAGFLAYPPAYLAKSTVFAAFAAHGLATLCAWPQASAGGPLAAGEHYIATDDRESSAVEHFAAVASRARAWYTEHSLPRQVATFGELLSACE
jgi:hypothetical protein